MKKRLIIVLQTLVSVGLLGWIFWKPDFRDQAWQVLTSAHIGWLAAGFFVAGLGNLMGVVRWNIFLRMQGIFLPPGEVLRISFFGLFLNNFLVGAVGGDVGKVVWLAAKGHRKSSALLSVMMDRMSGLVPLILASLVFILWRLEWLMQSAVVAGVIRFVFGYLFVVSALLAVSFVLAATKLIDRLPARLPGREAIREFNAAYLLFVKCWRPTLGASGLSLLILLGHFLTFYCSARAFGLRLPVLDFFAIMPAVDIISALPVSLGGFGVREQLFATVLGDLCGVPAALAVSVSLGGALLTMVWGVFGLFFLPSYRQALGGEETPKPSQAAAMRYLQWPWLYYYSKSKISLDPAYPVVAGILRDSPRPLLDIGCGMGLLAAYLRASGHGSAIFGMDLDAPKVELAQRVLRNERAEFRAGDALDFSGHCGDIVMLDVLHYFDDEGQKRLLEKMAASVAPSGVALIRVALNQPNWRFALTRWEEWFVKFIRWIPTSGKNFPTVDEVVGPFQAAGFAVEVRPMWGLTPFNSYLFVFHREGEAPAEPWLPSS